MKPTLMRSLRWAVCLCILATFPAYGQVENTTNAETASAANRDRPAENRAPPEEGEPIRQVRLIASAPDLGGVSRLDIPQEEQKTPSTRAPSAITSQAPTGQKAIVLSAVPVGPPPAQAKRSPRQVAQVANDSDHLSLSWRPASLAAGLVIAAAFLFWRLGERARQGGLDRVVTGHLPDEPGYPAEELPLLSLISAGRPETPSPSEPATPRPRFATLREALAAMDADRITASLPACRQVDA